jgi:SAM-dependent methyltransferase
VQISDRHVAFYDQELPTRVARPVSGHRAERLQDFVAACRERALTSVLEVGCGAGRDGLVLHGTGLTYAGVDLSPVGVQLCRDAGLDAQEASATALPFPDDSFDSGWSMSTLMHLPDGDMDAAVAELGRVVRPGGLLEVGVWGADEDGTWVDEHGRFFQQRSDAAFREMLSAVGTVEAFDTWDHFADGGHYQWARVLIR